MCEVVVNWELVYKYVSVLFAWPVMAFVIIIFVSSKFKEPISYWLKNLKVQYGETTISSNQAVESTKPTVLLEKQNKPKDGPTTYLETIPTDDPNELKKIVINWRENAYIWEYKYLNYFLVPNTKNVLHWLYCTKSSNFETYNNIFSQKIQDLSERTAVLKALENHFLIKPITSGVLEISEKGKEYTEVMLLPILNQLEKTVEEN